MKRFSLLLVVLLLLAGCSWTNHVLGRQADSRVGALYFNGTVLEAPTVLPGEDLEVLVKIIGTLGKKTEGDAAPQMVTISCRGDVELIGTCLKARPGNMVKVNGYLVQTGELIVKADYFAIK